MNNDEKAGRAWLRDTLGCPPDALDRLSTFVAQLRDENARQNLVARSDLDTVWWRHLVDSAQLLALARGAGVQDGVWLDLGTGAGFPGLVVAVLAPSYSVVLVEERRTRAEWLNRMITLLDLGGTEVRACGVARVDSLSAAVISARAFAPLTKLLNLSARFSTPDTLWLLPKGDKARQEVEGLEGQARTMFHVEHSVTSATAGIIVGRGVVPC